MPWDHAELCITLFLMLLNSALITLGKAATTQQSIRAEGPLRFALAGEIRIFGAPVGLCSESSLMWASRQGSTELSLGRGHCPGSSSGTLVMTCNLSRCVAPPPFWKKALAVFQGGPASSKERSHSLAHSKKEQNMLEHM